ncbi:MAG TPA: hypothetical protein PK337_05945 [Bacteroidia bacterium]|nr:hypothetical protein [Bacteroidia bacterium]
MSPHPAKSAGYFEWKEVCQSKLLCRACIPADRSDQGQTAGNVQLSLSDLGQTM